MHPVKRTQMTNSDIKTDILLSLHMVLVKSNTRGCSSSCSHCIVSNTTVFHVSMIKSQLDGTKIQEGNNMSTFFTKIKDPKERLHKK